MTDAVGYQVTVKQNTAIVDEVETVSYTHLDVYKRQVKGNSIEMASREQRNFFIVHFLPLDVYKRQIFICSKMKGSTCSRLI